MSRFFSALLLTVLTGSFASASQLHYSCHLPSGAPTLLEFVIDSVKQTITFSNIDGFGTGQMQKDTEFKLQTPMSGKPNTIAFEYDWYFSAQYEITFVKGDSWMPAPVGYGYGTILFSGDDSDGTLFDDIKLNCSVK